MKLPEPSTLLLIATLLPLFSALVLTVATRKCIFHAAGFFATGMMGIAFICVFAATVQWLGVAGPQHQTQLFTVDWIPLGNPMLAATKWLSLGIYIDSLTIAMATLVITISTLVHCYSMGYMQGDVRFNRFFAYLSLFTFSMMGIVISHSLLMLFIFWELVGLTSYLLIGFWFEKKGPQLACKKAFVMNRVGDAGFLIGVGILFYQLGGNLLLPGAENAGIPDVGSVTSALETLLSANHQTILDPPMWLTIAGIGLFCGAIGKSAQFPLQTWLPDAMEGPTPVSSIVHSATMVAAGVFLTARIYPILTPAAHLFISTTGLVTLVMAACMAMVMTDIKRVLAYSTLSQLGYMILGMGSGAYTFAVYHLLTHAFFKCCLFQCAGSVIQGAHHQQDMRYYGGLIRKLPVTAACFAVCTLAIAGASIPGLQIHLQDETIGAGLSGFYTKDGIIAGCVEYGQAMSGTVLWAPFFYLGPIIVAYMTSFYMARSFSMTFLGSPRDKHLYDHAHDPHVYMLGPQVALAALAIIASPWAQHFWIDLVKDATPLVGWVQTTRQGADEHAMHMVHTWVGPAWMIGIGLGVLLYSNRFGLAFVGWFSKLPVIRLIHAWVLNKFYFDALYDGLFVMLTKFFAMVIAWVDKRLVDGLVNLAGQVTIGIAVISGWIDRYIVDGLVNGSAELAQSGGALLRGTQTGRVRVYAMLLFAAVAGLTLVVVLASMPFWVEWFC